MLKDDLLLQNNRFICMYTPILLKPPATTNLKKDINK
jgi:hypothetical protein